MTRRHGPGHGEELREFGVWSETFERLHHAVTTGAPASEIRRLEAAELAQLESLAERDGGGERW
jgi:hypothetical protein